MTLYNKIKRISCRHFRAKRLAKRESSNKKLQELAEEELHYKRSRRVNVGNQLWTMKGGKQTKLKDMEESHINNVIALLERNATNDNDNIKAIMVFKEELGYR